MSPKTKIGIAVAIFLWASAFVGIRIGLQEYSPEGLALLRYLVASACMGLVYLRLPKRNAVRYRDIIAMLCVGALGIGVYNITLNYGEISISSGMASFIISQSPIITVIIATVFLGEQITLPRLLGFIVSVLGIALITVGEKGGFKWDMSICYILIATFAGGSFSLLQKPFLKRYHAIEATTYVIWGGTLFLMLFAPHLHQDITRASLHSTLTVVYLGVFPAAVGYICWAYVLKEISAARAMSFIYSTPFIATLLGWALLNEMPVWVSLAGGLLAIVGVWLVNQSYREGVKCSFEHMVK